MCEYSLHDVTSRPARVKDNVVTTEFTRSSIRALPPSGSTVPSS